MKRIIIISMLSVCILCQSCATIFSGTKCSVYVRNGNPQGAKVFMNGNYISDAPCRVSISKDGLRDGQATIYIKADGYVDQQIKLARKVKVAGVIGDIFLGVFPLIIDFADGAIYKAYPDVINYDLNKQTK